MGPDAAHLQRMDYTRYSDRFKRALWDGDLAVAVRPAFVHNAGAIPASL